MLRRMNRRAGEHSQSTDITPPPLSSSDLQDYLGNQTVASVIQEGDHHESPGGMFRRTTAGSGSPLPHQTMLERRFGRPLDHIRAFLGREDALSGIGADAAAFGDNVAFASHSPSPEVVGHEVAHVSQGAGEGLSTPQEVSETDSAAEREAQEIGSLIHRDEPAETEEPAGAELHRNALKTSVVQVTKLALKWLRKRPATISQHVAEHSKKVLGKAIHTVFLQPNLIRRMCNLAIAEAQQLVKAIAGQHVSQLQGPGIKVIKEAYGKSFRFVIEKVFDRPIGRTGESILRVVLSEAGEVITAYPVKTFMATGFTAGAMSIFDSSVAEASEMIRDSTPPQPEEESWWEPLLNPLNWSLYLSPSELGDATLTPEDLKMHDIRERMKTDLQTELGRPLTQEEQLAVFELLNAATQATLEMRTQAEDEDT